MKVENVLPTLNQYTNPGMRALSFKSKLTLMMAAPRASVADPPKATIIRQACKVLKLFEIADPTIPRNVIKEEMTNTGRFPRYSAAGTQKKF